MLTFQVPDKFVHDYLKEIADYYLFMHVSAVDDTKLEISIPRSHAADWIEKFNNRTLTQLESAILKTKTKVKVPADLVPNITLLIFYIAGAKHFLMNDQVGQAIDNQATSNYIKVYRLLKDTTQKQKLDSVKIDFITKNQTVASFDNLTHLYPLHEKILKAIQEALLISPNSDLYKTLQNPNTTSKELMSLEEQYSTTLYRLEKSTLANGAILLGRYLKEYAGLPNRGVMISDDQIRIVYNIYQILNWVEAKSKYEANAPEAYIKAFRNFVKSHRTLD